MRKAVIVPVAVVVLLCVVGTGWWFFSRSPGRLEWAREEIDKIVQELGILPLEEPRGLLVSGFIEADEASVTTELGGRIVSLQADEGDRVVAGQIVAQLNDSLLRAQILVAEAEVEVAITELALLQAGVRQEALDTARAMLTQAEVAEQAAWVAWHDAQAMLENPQELQLAVIAAEAQLGVLDFQEQQAEALANAAQVGRDLADESVRILSGFESRMEWVEIGRYSRDKLPPDIPLPPNAADGVYRIGEYRIVVSGKSVTVSVRARITVPADVKENARKEQASAMHQSWLAWTGLGQAQAAQTGAKAYAAELLAQIASPITLEVQANAAKSQLSIAAAAVEVARAQVEGMEIGATPEQIAAVDAQVEIARSELRSLEAQLDHYTLRAPLSGLVLERLVHPGEVALPGAPLMTLADLEHVTLTIYVPEDQLGKVRLGQAVSVTVDAYPDRVFGGTVSFIANQAEFTPKNVQTREERVNMVFAVRVSLPNPDQALKPGMPADAVLVEH